MLGGQPVLGDDDNDASPRRQLLGAVERLLRAPDDPASSVQPDEHVERTPPLGCDHQGGHATQLPFDHRGDGISGPADSAAAASVRSRTSCGVRVSMGGKPWACMAERIAAASGSSGTVHPPLTGRRHYSIITFGPIRMTAGQLDPPARRGRVQAPCGMIPAGDFPLGGRGLGGCRTTGQVAATRDNGGHVAELSELLDVLDLEPVGEGRFRAQNFSEGPGGVVFGGQLLAQAIVAGATIDPTKEVKSIHTIFARGGAPRQAARH